MTLFLIFNIKTHVTDNHNYFPTPGAIFTRRNELNQHEVLGMDK